MHRQSQTNPHRYLAMAFPALSSFAPGRFHFRDQAEAAEMACTPRFEDARVPPDLVGAMCRQRVLEEEARMFNLDCG